MNEHINNRIVRNLLVNCTERMGKYSRWYNAFQQSGENWGDGYGSVVGGGEWRRYFGYWQN